MNFWIGFGVGVVIGLFLAIWILAILANSKRRDYEQGSF